MPACAAAGRACRLGALVLTMSSCAGEPLRPGTPRDITALRINPFELHEECVRMKPGDVLDYRFEAQRPVTFNIHYHEGKAVILPVARDNVTADEGTFQPLTAQEYCLMWEAGREGAILDFSVTLIPKKR